MSHRPNLFFIACVYIVASSVAQTYAAEDRGRDELIRNIITEWRERQLQVKTIICKAKVDSFYPKGYLTERMSPPEQKKIGGEDLPKEDKHFMNEPCLWAIDLVAKSVRKEKRITGPFSGPAGWDLVVANDVHVFRNGEYRLFHPDKSDLQQSATTDVLIPDMTLYGDAAESCVFSMADLPLLWLAGEVNGRYPLPTEMKRLEPPGRFSYRGEAEWEGHKCVVLTTQEQKNGTMVRELWIGLEKPYPVYCCRIRDGGRVWYQNEVEYRKKDGRYIPTTWKHTEYNFPTGKLFSMQQYSVEKIEFNRPLQADAFEESLKPGMIVLDAKKNEDLEVDHNGRLVPLGSVGRNKNAQIILWGGSALALIIGIVLVWRRFRRRPAAS